MILVTGGTGFLGSHTVRRLLEESRQVRVLVRNRRRAQAEGRLEGWDTEWAIGDVTEPATLGAALKGIDTVIHTAAIAIEKGQASYEQINYRGTVNLVEAARQAGAERFINISQLGAAPDLPYRFLASKGKAQAYVAESGLKWTAFRPSTLFGPEDEFANTFARLVPLTPIIFPIVGTEESRFQPVWVGDVASAVLRALDDEATIHEEYELGGPEVLTLEEIERRTLQAVGARRWMVPTPLPLLKVVVAAMEALLPNPPVTSSLLELLQISNITTDNGLPGFVDSPRAFSVDNVAPYMKEFRLGQTLSAFFGR